MGSQVYIVEGPGLTPKVTVVDHELEHETVLDITNRFEPKGQHYTTLTAVETGILLLTEAKHGKHDSAFLPGSDDAQVNCEGHYPTVPASTVRTDCTITSRRAWEMRYTAEDGRCQNYLLVTPQPSGAVAQGIAEGLSSDFPAGTLELKRVLAGTYQLKPELGAPGFTLRSQLAYPA